MKYNYYESWADIDLCPVHVCDKNERPRMLDESCFLCVKEILKEFHDPESKRFCIKNGRYYNRKR